MGLTATKVNTGKTSKGVLAGAALSKHTAKPGLKVAAKPVSKAATAQKLATSSRASLVSKPALKSHEAQGATTRSTLRMAAAVGTPNVAPKVAPKAAPAPIDPRFEPFRLLLEAKRTELQASLGDTRFGAQGQNGRVAEEDQAAVSHEEFISSKRNSMEFRMLRLVNAALDRIVRGEYGICHACEEEISEKRLKAISWAEFCVLCQDTHGNVDHDGPEAATPAGAAPALQVWNW